MIERQGSGDSRSSLSSLHPEDGVRKEVEYSACVKSGKPELGGAIVWGRDFIEPLQRGRFLNKPLLVLITCSTIRNL